MCQLCGIGCHHERTTRRGLLRAGAFMSLAAWGGSAALAATTPASTAPAPNDIGPAAAMKRLMAGNARYVANAPRERDFSSGRAARAQAQYPIAAILSCADSRVAPELAFDQGPGDLFVVRVAGNVVSPDLLASLEYGVQYLGTPLLMVLGHTGCGAVDAAIKVLKTHAELPGHLPQLVASIKPAVHAAEAAAGGDLLDNACAENVRLQVAGLKRAGPVIQAHYAAGRINIVGAIYDLRSGKVGLV